MAGTAYRNATWTAKVLIMPVKVLAWDGSGLDSDIFSGAVWAVDHGANVLNMSFGGVDGSDTMQAAVNYAYNNGCICVAAAGNDGSTVWYPAAYSTVISVAATDSNDQRASFSNFGKIDVSAPGVDIWSCNNVPSVPYSSEDGTSFSSPHVAGLAALIVMKYPGISPDQAVKLIEQTSDTLNANGYDQYTGWGRINVLRALSSPQNFSRAAAVNTYNWPNPFSPENDMFTNITFVAPSPQNVSVIIYDGGGNVVWRASLPAASVPAGQNIIKWNGVNSSGRSVANGTYFYVLKAGGSTGKNKIMVIH
jgi:subtilisin family serine protease